MKLGRLLIPVLALLVSGEAQFLGAQDDEANARKLALPKLEQVELPKWRKFVRPDEEELTFEGIDWLEDFASGMRASDAQQKPLLFWAMNGHPLGCT